VTITGARRSARRRVSGWVPGVGMAIGLVMFGAGMRWTGIGVAVGGVLAYTNGVVLSKRVDAAAGTGNMAGALLVMQTGLLITMAVIAAATIVLVKISLPMAVACAISFGVGQIVILAVYYMTQARSESGAEAGATS